MSVMTAKAPARARARSRGRIWRAVLITLGALLVIAFVGASLYGANSVTAPMRLAADPAVATSISPNYTDVSFPSRNNATALKGWLFHAPNNAGQSVIITHGWRVNRIDPGWGTDKIAKDLLQHGYDVLVFDFSGRGESQGDRFTMGTKEYKDVLGAYDFLKSGASGKSYPPAKMAAMGDSMGAASVLLASRDMPDVGAIVADSSFAHLWPVLQQEIPKRSVLPGFMVAPVLQTARLFGLDPDLSPVDAVRAQPSRAFLFFNASNETFIWPSNAQELYSACGNPNCKLVLVPSDKHVYTYLADPAAYMAQVYGFFDSQLAK